MPCSRHISMASTIFDIWSVFSLKINLELGAPDTSTTTGNPPSLATGQTELAEAECFASLFSRNISL